MKKHIFLILVIWATLSDSPYAQSPRTIHVFVALCDNVHQGIVPVPEKIGNGKDPFNNLYWGAGYGVKTYFDKKSGDWEFKSEVKNPSSGILERIVFKHKRKEVYLLADAYDGEKIRKATEDFLWSAAGCFELTDSLDGHKLYFGGKSDFLAYIGHDGLMDFDVELDLCPVDTLFREVVILACYSKEYFAPHIRSAGAHPLIWTNGLMAPEAYTLEWALDGWVLDETDEQIRDRAARAYSHYQECSLKAARWLLRTGF
jgi:hypothetical protein